MTASGCRRRRCKWETWNTGENERTASRGTVGRRRGESEGGEKLARTHFRCVANVIYSALPYLWDELPSVYTPRRRYATAVFLAREHPSVSRMAVALLWQGLRRCAVPRRSPLSGAACGPHGRGRVLSTPCCLVYAQTRHLPPGLAAFWVTQVAKPTALHGNVRMDTDPIMGMARIPSVCTHWAGYISPSVQSGGFVRRNEQTRESVFLGAKLLMARSH